MKAISLMAAVFLTIWPLSDFVGHAHWTRVVLVPFSERHLSWRDVIGNLLLFFPFGLVSAWGTSKTAGQALRVGLLVMALSSASEFYQIFCHRRFPTATDVCSNTAGALMGFLSARRAPKRVTAAQVSR